MSPEKRIIMDNHVIAVCAVCAFAAGIFGAGYLFGFRNGNFAAGLEENKIAALRLTEKDFGISPEMAIPMSPEFREFLKGRIYYNIASKFPNDAGYLLRSDWDFGPVDQTVLKRPIYAKDPTCPADSFDAATSNLSAAEKPSIKATAKDRFVSPGQSATSQP